MNHYAVYMDYKYEDSINTVVLGGSLAESREDSCIFLAVMADAGFEEDWTTFDRWEVDEDDLPWGYDYQTYYVAAYDPAQTMLGVK